MVDVHDPRATEPAATPSGGPVEQAIALPSGTTVRYVEQGHGPAFLVLHGGGGPFTVAGLAAHLATTGPAHTLVPTMPGFDGTARPPTCRSVGDVAEVYLELIDALDLHGVTVVGSSAGGWAAAAMAVAQVAHGLPPDHRVTGIVLINAVGIAVEGHPITDVSGLRIDQLADLSYFEPDRFRIDPAALPPARQQLMTANAAVFADYAGDPYMHDPALAAGLATIDVPALVLWGEADGIVDLDYGRAYADAIPGAVFTSVPRAGHLPHVERPDAVHDHIWGFATRCSVQVPDGSAVFPGPAGRAAAGCGERDPQLVPVAAVGRRGVLE